MKASMKDSKVGKVGWPRSCLIGTNAQALEVLIWREERGQAHFPGTFDLRACSEPVEADIQGLAAALALLDNQFLE